MSIENLKTKKEQFDFIQIESLLGGNLSYALDKIRLSLIERSSEGYADILNINVFTDLCNALTDLLHNISKEKLTSFVKLFENISFDSNFYHSKNHDNYDNLKNLELWIRETKNHLYGLSGLLEKNAPELIEYLKKAEHELDQAEKACYEMSTKL